MEDHDEILVRAHAIEREGEARNEGGCREIVLVGIERMEAQFQHLAMLDRIACDTELGIAGGDPALRAADLLATRQDIVAARVQVALEAGDLDEDGVPHPPRKFVDEDLALAVRDAIDFVGRALGGIRDGCDGGEFETFVLNSPLFNRKLSIINSLKHFIRDSGRLEILEVD